MIWRACNEAGSPLELELEGVVAASVRAAIGHMNGAAGDKA